MKSVPVRRPAPTLLSCLLVAAALALACPSEDASTPSPAEPAATETAEVAPAKAARALAPSGAPYSEDRAPCADRDPLKQALWGELHVHSRYSMDAYIWDVRAGADDVYSFAMGNETFFPPLDDSGRPVRPAQLERPLDFAALTDHASFQGEVELCTRPGSDVYDSESCRVFRADKGVDLSAASIAEVAGVGDLGDISEVGIRMAQISDGDPAALEPSRSKTLCGDGERCREAMRMVWTEQQAAAERHYDRSAQCNFTTLHAYEYTATPGLAKVHHNVIFRNANVPAAPIPWIDEPDVYGLWQKLSDQCLEAGTGCDVITIPHNSNLSNGNMFAITGKDLPLETQRARAVLRADIERLGEITQIKGDSECRNGMFQVFGEPDEFCNYEDWRSVDAPDCGADGKGYGGLADQGCVSRHDYLRYTLLEGFREQQRIGVNPYKLGFIAATDQHNANPGDVEEYSYQGWRGSQDATPAQRMPSMPPEMPPIGDPLAVTPGGLAGVWAEENSRDAIFDAMKRKETFATSGPRITARLFGGWGYASDLCGATDLVSQGYAGGVPMGTDLPARPEGAGAPSFVVSAMRDLGTEAHPGGKLQRAQIVKGWVDAEGGFQQRVYDVAGGETNASVDLDTCEPEGPGHDSLCSVWTDPDFDPATPAVYYLRVLENPSCRWNQHQCAALPEEERPASCGDPSVPRTNQERLWTSPIWYEAEAPAAAS